MGKLKPKDIVALLVIIGLILFKLTGNNGSLDVAVAVVVGYYFVKRENGQDKGV